MADRDVHDDEDIRLIDLLNLADDNGVIAGHTFQGCRFYGPAVLAFVDNVQLQATHVVGPGNPDDYLWEISPDREFIIGAFGLRDCDLFGCSYRMIGFAVTPEEAEAIRRDSTAI